MGQKLGRIIALALLLVTGTLAFAQGKITLRVSTAAVPDDWHARALQVFKSYVENADPNIKVEVYPASQLFKQDAQLPAMQRGTLDLAYVSAQQLSTVLPDVTPLTAGYVIQSPLHLCSVWNGPFGDELKQKISQKVGITVLDALYLGTRELNLRTDKPIRTPDDLAGIKLRMPNSKAWLFLGKALGANPVPLAFSELYLALQTGTVDGQDNPLPTDYRAKFYEVTKQIVLTDHLVDGLLLAVSNRTLKKLSPRQREILREAARAASFFNNRNRISEEQQLIEFFKSKGLKVTVPDREAFRKRVLAAYESSEFSKNWPPGILEKIQSYAKQIPDECRAYFQ